MPITLDVAKWITDQESPLESMNKNLLDIYKQREAAKVSAGTLAETERHNLATEGQTKKTAAQAALEKMQKETQKSFEDRTRGYFTEVMGSLKEMMNRENMPYYQNVIKAWNEITDPTNEGYVSDESKAIINMPQVRKSIQELMMKEVPGTKQPFKNYMKKALSSYDLPQDFIEKGIPDELLAQGSISEMTNAALQRYMIGSKKGALKSQLEPEAAPSPEATPAPAASIMPAPGVPAAPAAPVAPSAPSAQPPSQGPFAPPPSEVGAGIRELAISAQSPGIQASRPGMDKQRAVALGQEYVKAHPQKKGQNDARYKEEIIKYIRANMRK